MATRKKKSVRKKVTRKKTSVRKVARKKATIRKKSGTTRKKAARKKVTAKKKVIRKKRGRPKKSANTKKTTRLKKKVAAPKRKAQGGKSSAKMIVSKNVGRKGSRHASGNYMTPEQLELFRDKLTAWKKELMREVDRTVVHMQEESSIFADANDRATQEEEFGRELKSRDRERKLIKKINEALVRVDNNEFGYCEECKAPIGMVRLKARPITTMCIDCKTLAEVIEKQGFRA